MRRRRGSGWRPPAGACTRLSTGTRPGPDNLGVMDVELPKLADTLVEGTISRWLKQAGETVRRGEPLVEIETDKGNSELEAPADGVLEVVVAAGETVPLGQVIARIGDGDRETPVGVHHAMTAPAGALR